MHQKGDSNLGFSANTLKMIACAAMVVDHFAYIVVRDLYLEVCAADGVRLMGWMGAEELYSLYLAMRTIGRLAFPIFCFALVQGYRHTGNFGQYLSRLLVFAIVSEIPFDLMDGALVDWHGQNVMWTLLIGLMLLRAWDYLEEKSIPFTNGLRFICVLAACGISYALRTDYYIVGVLLILVLHVGRERPLRLILGVFAVNAMAAVLFESQTQIYAVLAIPFLFLYKGSRGAGGKYFFYAFYPVHLLALELLVWIVD